MKIVPVTLKQANLFVDQFHRHNKHCTGCKFTLGLERDGELVGVAIAGRPVARHLDNGKNLEVNRVCVKEGVKNGCSMLYSRCKRIGILMGYERVLTYTLADESGSSLKAVGAKVVGRIKGSKQRTWNYVGQKRQHQDIYTKEKLLWEL